MPLDEATIDGFSSLRRQMVDAQLRARGIHDPRVLDAMLRVPRQEFVDEQYRNQAYEDHPLPIGEDQTISQPFIIAISLQALELKGMESVLEIGTGSGYQTALLALLAREVYSIERHLTLAGSAAATLARLGLGNVRIQVGDGSRGWLEHAPYNAILVAAAAPRLPASLIQQLAEGGRMVIPVGPPTSQVLQLVRKSEGNLVITSMEACRFVPLIGAEGYYS
jgi:protein-L-isoaspartate(D-aspartate) O-methyltransferase